MEAISMFSRQCLGRRLRGADGPGLYRLASPPALR